MLMRLVKILARSPDIPADYRPARIAVPRRRSGSRWSIRKTMARPDNALLAIDGSERRPYLP